MAALRIAVHHSFPGKAEAETAARTVIAAARLGLEGRAVVTAEEIEAFAPDFVLCLSHHEGKVSAYPTYGVVMAPRHWMDNPTGVSNILAYDGYLTLSPALRDWVAGLRAAAGLGPPLVADYTNMPHATPWIGGAGTPPSLAYIGTNWDGHRHLELFTALARRPDVRFFGHAESWRHVHPAAYHGPVPFDGESTLATYRAAGAGLGIDHPEFAGDNLANRAYEIVAAGVPALVGELPILRQTFGDTLYYLDAAATARVILWQIDRHLATIAARPDEAEARARAAHQIFLRDLALERLLPNVVALHRRVLAQQEAVGHPPTPAAVAACTPAAAETARRLVVLEDVTGSGPVRLAGLPAGGTAVLQAHFDAEPSGAVSLRATDGQCRVLPLPEARRIGNVWRVDVGLDSAMLAAGVAADFQVAAGLVGLGLRAVFDAEICRVEQVAASGRVWIFGAAKGGARVARTLLSLTGKRCDGFIDDYRSGLVDGVAVHRLAEAPRLMGDDDCIILASRHWLTMWRQTAGLPPRRVFTADPWYGAELASLPSR